MIYSLTEDVFTDEEGVKHKTYGISAKDFNGYLFAAYSDIFLDKQNAENLVKLCNKSELELCHLSEVVEDALS